MGDHTTTTTMRLRRCSRTLQLLQSDDAVSAIGSRFTAVSGADDAVRTEVMEFGPPLQAPSSSCCTPNLLGGSRRTTAPGCIRSLPVPSIHQQRDSSTAASTCQITETLTTDYPTVCQSSRDNSAVKKMTVFKTSDRNCQLGGLSIGTTGRCCIETAKHEEGHVEQDYLSGTDVTADVSSTSELKQNKVKDRYEFQSPPFDLTSSRSRTLSSDVHGLQSFQVPSPKSSNIVRNRSQDVARFFSRMSLKSLRRLFVATADRHRGRPAASLTDSLSSTSSCQSTLKTPAALAGSGAPSKELSSKVTAAVPSSLRLRLGRFRRHDVPQHTGSSIITTNNNVSRSNTSVPLTDVVSRVVERCKTEGADAENQHEQIIDTSGTVVGDFTITEQYSKSTGILRLLQPPTSLDLAVPRGLTTSPRQWQVRRHCPTSLYDSTESIGQCSVDALASTNAG